ncbi:uncharacterized protein I303_102663 [Kwoniella dejecticola CBS 10117]|uniref:Methyltransferase domain-containing protein n=1 Tax=Kwoniella dejecticola CBS 10117 TaxID=1296121 RepID=A0A1A6A9D0_9TREE|nr:uncharacterized protein I303_02678 [Kwoniella dejecticola CBS 10117]OBR86667.1 hypothetical protein I303_02678 [Kwoniella dejecticola CBS 10117]
MSYPSIITQEGAAQRNKQPIIDALSSLIGDDTEGEIIEFGSGSYEHIESFAKKWEKVVWWGTVRNETEQGIVSTRLEEQNVRLLNLREPRVLDISKESDWGSLYKGLQFGVSGPFLGCLMINLIHCCPVELPEQVFEHLSPINARLVHKPLESDRSWIAAYGPWLNDDGTYKSSEDEKFDKEYIRFKSPLLGLRTIKSVSEIAERWGFIEESRKEMPKGNVFVIWRVRT